ncbi:DUF4142 domain-containing protein [Nostoc ellipsosporum NOK]|nr:DUF4142 domain-containing protein [Nostoc ellipsosporum NOK]
MKKSLLAMLLSGAVLCACNNENSNSNPETGSDSASRNQEVGGGDTSSMTGTSNAGSMNTDDNTRDFLVKAAEGGMAEVEAGQLAQQKSTNNRVTSFAGMMVNDHTGANSSIKSLAQARNVQLPSTAPEAKKQKAAKAGEKTGTAFDKAYMDMMVADHEETIALFKKGRDQSQDPEVKSFIENTIPKLEVHLDSAKAIRKSLR